MKEITLQENTIKLLEPVKTAFNQLLQEKALIEEKLNQTVALQSDKLVTLTMKKLTAVKLVSQENLVSDQLYVVFL